MSTRNDIEAARRGAVAPAAPLVWKFGGWTACVILVLAVQAITIAVAAFGWRE